MQWRRVAKQEVEVEVAVIAGARMGCEIEECARPVVLLSSSEDNDLHRSVAGLLFVVRLRREHEAFFSQLQSPNRHSYIRLQSH